MRCNLRTRRMFLRGVAGTSLSIPFLPSLLSSALAQAAPLSELKYLQVIENMGALRTQITPPSAHFPQVDIGAGAKARPLSELVRANGRISETYGSWWNDLAPHINLISNYSGYWENWNHHLVDSLVSTQDETGAPLMDNLVFYHAREYASALNSTGQAHDPRRYNCVVGGKAGGRLQTGQFVDAGGAPMGRILITLMKAMGLSIGAIEQAGRVGFGEYSTNGHELTGAEAQAFLSDEGKRLGLPIVADFDRNEV